MPLPLPNGRVTISIHALRKESDPVHDWPIQVVVISIHALRKESDTLLKLLDAELP